MDPASWIDLEAPPADAVLLGEVADPVTPDWHTWLFRRGEYMILRTRRTSTGSEGQRVVPWAAVGWIHAAIADGFWAPGATHTHVETTLAGERLELRRSWGFGGPDGKGFTLVNHDREAPKGYPAEYPMTDELLIDGGLLSLFARLSGRA